jgi:diguanylate cyclase (GGDEF)-like protein
MDRPSVIAAVAVGPSDSVPASIAGVAPILMSVKFVNGRMLSRIATQLHLTNLRKLDQESPPVGDLALDVNDPDGNVIGRFAWTPKRPGAVQNVVPFIAVASIGFALLAAFVLRYMRRTAAAIAAGESRLRHLAMHDPLCGLPNRIYFGERLEAVIEEVRVGTATAAVFYIDLDHFKDVNDTLGHHVGDELIRNVTLRLSHTLRGGDLVARLSGDEFEVISSIAGDSEQMMGLAQRIIAAICAPYIINGQNIIIGASLGIAIVDNKCGTATDIMRYADMALYRAKNEGRNRACIYDAAMDADLSSRKLLEPDFARGDRERPPEASVSARRQQERRGGRRRRSALPLDASDPRRNSAKRIHCHCRAQRIDHRPWKLGAAPRVYGRQGLAGSHHRGQRVVSPIPAHRFRRGGREDPERNPLQSGASRTRTDGKRAARQRGHRGGRHGAPQGARRAGCAR